MNANGSGLKELVAFVPADESDKYFSRHRSPLVWSSDGQTLAFLVEEFKQGFYERQPRRNVLYAVATDGSNQVRPVEEAYRGYEYSSFISPIAWSPDGRRIAYLRRSKFLPPIYTLNTVSPDGSHRREVTRMELADSTAYLQADSLSWSPNGERILFSLGQMMYVVNADGSNLHSVLNERYGSWSPNGSRIAISVPGESEIGFLYTTQPDGLEVKVLR